MSVTPYNTHGSRASETVETDYEGNAFLITRLGAIVTGTVTAGIFTADAISGQPIYRVDRLQRELDGALGFIGLVDMQREAFAVDYYLIADTGSTTTNIAVLEPAIANVGSGCGYILEIGDNIEGQPRPPYIVDSITGNDTIVLTGAMSEEPPAKGARMRLIAKRKPLPNATDFPLPAHAFQVSGNWFVYEISTRKIWRATLNIVTGRIDKTSSGSGDCDLVIGATEGNGNVTVNHKPRGNWNFSSATVTGISFATLSPATTRGDLITRDATTTVRLPIGAANSLLGSDGTDPSWFACTAAGRAVLDDATAGDQRTTLGLGSIATQAASGVTITGGSITGITDLALADGGTGASTKDGAFDAIVHHIINLGGAVTNALAAGSNTAALYGSATTTAKFVVPAGKSFKVLQVWGSGTAGATVGTYTFDIGVKKISSGAFTSLANATGAANALISPFAQGTIASPLATYAAADDIMPAFRNNATSPGALANTLHSVNVVGVLV
jgi:hypothetical protein